ncbi:MULTISPECIES: hypothetical protein [unclassified Moraxella]|uniref:hypothetical protein n=1 Tax=unclassified Moraxella TaxID=2685852 RepID=UPI003AF8F6E7
MTVINYHISIEDSQNNQSDFVEDNLTEPTDELLYQISGIRPFTGGKHIITNEMVNQIREQEEI